MLVKTQSYYCQNKTRPLKTCLLNLTLMNKATLYAIENRTQTYSHCWSHICIIHLPKLNTTCTVSQCETVPRMLDYTKTVFFLVPIFPITVPRLFSDTKFYQYRYRYFFPVPNIFDTETSTFLGTNFFR